MCIEEGGDLSFHRIKMPFSSQKQCESVCDVVEERLEEDEEVHALNRQIFKRALSTILPTCVITLGVIFALLTHMGTLTTMARGNDVQVSHGQHVFLVSSRVRPTVILRGNAGQINVVPGPAGRVIMKYAIRHTGAGRPATVAFGQNSKTNSVLGREIDYPRVGSGSDQVDWSITLPKSSNLDFITGAGPITVVGVSGHVSLITNAGDVTANNVFFQDNSALSTQAGSIHLVGNVQVGSTCKIHTNAGSVDVSFPSSARLYINASLLAGVVSSDFSGVSTSRRGASGYIGHGPYGKVFISILAGVISIHRL